jgi:hypothetical protein
MAKLHKLSKDTTEFMLELSREEAAHAIACLVKQLADVGDGACPSFVSASSGHDDIVHCRFNIVVGKKLICCNSTSCNIAIKFI